jgi:hypothetical protein
MKVYKTWDNFLWADVTPIAESLWQSADMELYAIYDDGSEHLIESESELVSVLKDNTPICIELCNLNEIININYKN